MSPWLLLIILMLPAGPEYGIMLAASERVCHEQAAKIQARVTTTPVLLACYELRDGT